MEPVHACAQRLSGGLGILASPLRIRPMQCGQEKALGRAEGVVSKLLSQSGIRNAEITPQPLAANRIAVNIRFKDGLQATLFNNRAGYNEWHHNFFQSSGEIMVIKDAVKELIKCYNAFHHSLSE